MIFLVTPPSAHTWQHETYAPRLSVQGQRSRRHDIDNGAEEYSVSLFVSVASTPPKAMAFALMLLGTAMLVSLLAYWLCGYPGVAMLYRRHNILLLIV